MKKTLPLCSLLTVLLLCVCAPPPAVQAGFMDKVNKSVNNSRRKIDNSIKRTKNKVQKKTNSIRRSAEKKEREIREKTRREQQRAKEIARRKQQQLNKSFAKKRQDYGSSAKRAGQAFKKSTAHGSSSYKSAAMKVKNYAGGSKKTFHNIDTAVREATRRYGSKAKTTLDQTRRKYGKKAAQVVATQMAQAERNGLTVAKKSKALMDRVGRRVRDPRLRKKAMLGAAVAGGVAYYAYTHQDDVKYKAIRYGMDHTKLKVNGRESSASELISNAILKQAPYLRGTRIAEDPAAVMAYGVVAVGKEDMINRVDLVPDGRGGRQTVSESIRQAEHGDEAIAALQVSSSIEGMALTAAEQGDLGRYGQEFASSYNAMEGVINE